MELVKKTLPNSTATLVLGIVSILSCWLYGFIGVIVAIVALVISKKSLKLYYDNPEQYEGVGNLTAGRTMAIIGLVLSGLFLLGIIIVISFLGAAAISLESFLSKVLETSNF